MNEEKKLKIKESLLKTKLKRKSQQCKVVELKIIDNKLNAVQRQKLKMFFIEAKWLYNHLLNKSQDKEFDLFSYDYKNKIVKVKNKDNNEIERYLVNLPAKLRQDILYNIIRNITSLSRLKKNGHMVGRLKFKSSYNCIDLTQYGKSHIITSKNKFKIAGIKKHLLVKGLHQIKNNYEFANAKLIKKASGYYVKLTCYEFIKPEAFENISNKNEIGIDFGIKNTLTLSNGDIFNLSIEEHEQLKKVQRKLSRSKKGSNNRFKLRIKLQKEYEKLTNRKKDLVNKLVSNLINNYSSIYIQDDNFNEWKKDKNHNTNKKVYNSCLGLVKLKLKQQKNVFILSKWIPTTKFCYNCGKENKISLQERLYICECGLNEDRDIKAAKTILHLGSCKSKNTYGS